MKGSVSADTDPVLDVGTKVFEITETSDGKAKAGHLKVTCGLIVLGGADKGTRISHVVNFFEAGHAAAWVAKAFMSAIGVDRNPQTNEFEYDTDNWPGRKFVADVEHGDYNGQKQNKLRKIRPYNGQDTEAPF